MPPANARNVTRMLLVKIALETAACLVGREAAGVGARLGRALELGGDDADRRRRVVDRPDDGQRHGTKSSASARPSSSGRSRTRCQ